MTSDEQLEEWLEVGLFTRNISNKDKPFETEKIEEVSGIGYKRIKLDKKMFTKHCNEEKEFWTNDYTIRFPVAESDWGCINFIRVWHPKGKYIDFPLPISRKVSVGICTRILPKNLTIFLDTCL